MFGYIVVHRPELKVKEYEAYQAAYCGLCSSLRRRHGWLGQMTLSYDMTFLALLLTGLYEPKTRICIRGCLAHPGRRHACRENPYYDYAADMNVLLTYYKCHDDWQDERKFVRLLYGCLLKSRVRKLQKQYGKKTAKIETLLKKLRRLEEKKICDVDKTAGLFGEIMAELFVCREDAWEPRLRRMGFFFGKFIYLMDAYEDVEEDLKKGNYNAFSDWYGQDDFDKECSGVLKMMMAESSRVFETLPVLKDAGILRNILYAGVWTRYRQVRQRRKENREKP